MANYFYKYIPVRRGLTGMEYLPGFLDEFYPGVSFNGIISDGIADFGILTGTDESLPKAMAAIEGRFSAVRLDEASFVGVVARHYNEAATDPEGNPVPTLSAYLTANGITPPADAAATLVAKKTAKKQLFKEIAKKKFSDDNDSIADLARVVTLLNLHYADLTTEEKATVDALTATVKSIYTKALCTSSLQSLVSKLQTALTDYYTACASVDAAADAAAVDAVNFV